MNVSEPPRQETSSGAADSMTQPTPPTALSLGAQTQTQPLPLSPTPASVPRLQLQRTSVGGRLPAPQPPCPRWNADQKTRHNRSAPDWGGSGSSVPRPAICPQALEQMLGMAVPPGSLPAYTPVGPAQRGHSFLSFIHAIFPEHLLCASPCSRHWEYNREQERQGVCPLAADGLAGTQPQTSKQTDT